MSVDVDALAYLAARVLVGDRNVVRAAISVALGDFASTAARKWGVTKWQVRRLNETLRTLASLNLPQLEIVSAWLDELEAELASEVPGGAGEGVCPVCGARLHPKRTLVFHVYTAHKKLLAELSVRALNRCSPRPLAASASAEA